MAKAITVGTAHRLQGAERPVVLFSSVYGNRSAQASFIDGTLELMNVGVSRAKDLFIVFGGASRCSDTGPIFSLVHRYATKSDCSFAETNKTKGSVDKDNSSASPPDPDPGREPVASTSEQTAARCSQPECRAVRTGEELLTANSFDHHLAEPERRTVHPGEQGYMTVSGLIAMWKADGTLPKDSKANARKLNTILVETGLIESVNGVKLPTAAGRRLGIAIYTGQGGNGPYTNTSYSPDAQDALTRMVREGYLPL